MPANRPRSAPAKGRRATPDRDSDQRFAAPHHRYKGRGISPACPDARPVINSRANRIAVKGWRTGSGQPMTIDKDCIDNSALGPLRGASLSDIRAFFDALVTRDSTPGGVGEAADVIGTLRPGEDPRQASGALLDDLTIVFQHTLERSRERGEIAAGVDVEKAARELTAAFRSVLFMQHEGYSAEEVRRFLDHSLQVLAPSGHRDS